MLQKESQHFSRGVGAVRIGVSAVRATAEPGMAAPVHEPLLNDHRAGLVPSHRAGMPTNCGMLSPLARPMDCQPIKAEVSKLRHAELRALPSGPAFQSFDGCDCSDRVSASRSAEAIVSGSMTSAVRPMTLFSIARLMAATSLGDSDGTGSRPDKAR